MKARALLVGINSYPGLGSNLTGPENDVAAMEAWLRSPAGGSLDPAQDIVKITTSTNHRKRPPKSYADAKPIMSQIYHWVDRLVVEASKKKGDFPLGDRLYLFFAGHGHHAAGKTAMFMANAWANNLGEAIPMQPLAEFMRSSAFFQEVILIADACREQIDFAPDPYFSHKAAVSSNAGAVLKFDAYPCPAGLKTKEVDFNGKTGGVLTNAFLTGVGGLAAQGGVVWSNSLKDYMINAVNERLEQDPEVNCSEQGNRFKIAAAADKKTLLTVTRKAGAPAGMVTLLDGTFNAPIVVQDLSAGPLVTDLTPGFYALKRIGSDEKVIRVAWETTYVEY